MPHARFRLRTLLILVALLALVLATAGRWVASGCPMGVTCGSGTATFNGRMFTASSDRLLGNVGVSIRSDCAELNVEGRRIIIRNDEAVIDDGLSVVIPIGCREVEFAISGAELMVSFDQRPATAIPNR